MRKNDPQTPLLAVLRALDDDQRKAFAKKAGTSVSYLYALATCARASCRVRLATRIANASVEMQKKVPLCPVITVNEIATMCAYF